MYNDENHCHNKLMVYNIENHKNSNFSHNNLWKLELMIKKIDYGFLKKDLFMDNFIYKETFLIYF